MVGRVEEAFINEFANSPLNGETEINGFSWTRSVFALYGCSVSNAKIFSLNLLWGYKIVSGIHTRGNFPMKSNSSDYDTNRGKIKALR